MERDCETHRDYVQEYGGDLDLSDAMSLVIMMYDG